MRPAVSWALAALAVAAGASVVLLDRPAADAARAPSYNNPLRAGRIDACVPTVQPHGIPAYTVDGRALPFGFATGHEPGTHPRCGPGELRILRLQAVTIYAGPAYIRRGGCQQPCFFRQPTAHILGRDLARPVALLPIAARNGDGAPAPGCSRQIRAAPALVGGDLGRMFYKTPDELHATHRRTGVIGAGARWSNYGDPGRRYPTPRGATADYSYLLWNLPRRQTGGLLHGGGIVEAVIAQGESLALCAVPELLLPSFDAHGTRNGSVSFGYARAANPPSPPIYGWLPLGYRYGARPFRATITTP